MPLLVPRYGNNGDNSALYENHAISNHVHGTALSTCNGTVATSTSQCPDTTGSQALLT
jgi:hypothetical protein